MRFSGLDSLAMAAKRDGRSAQYAGNSVRDCEARMNSGAVMLERSPETVARKLMKSLRADKLPTLTMKSVSTVMLAVRMLGARRKAMNVL